MTTVRIAVARDATGACHARGGSNMPIDVAMALASAALPNEWQDRYLVTLDLPSLTATVERVG